MFKNKIFILSALFLTITLTFKSLAVFAVEKNSSTNSLLENKISESYVQPNEVKTTDVENAEVNNTLEYNNNDSLVYDNYIANDVIENSIEEKNKDKEKSINEEDIKNTLIQNNPGDIKDRKTKTLSTIDTIDNGTYIIESAINSNYVLDIENNSQQSGANLRLYHNFEKKNQIFNIKKDENGYYTIISVNSNKVLDVANACKNAGTNVWQCWQNDSDAQKWTIKDAGDGYYYFISKCNDLYLDVSNGIAANGTNIQVCYGNNSKAQKFKLKEFSNINFEDIIENGIYEIETGVNKNKCLEVTNASKSSGGNVHIYGKTRVYCQKVFVEYNEDGYYTLMFLHSGKFLDVANAGKEAGTNVWQCWKNGSDAQKWTIKDVGDGYYNLISKCNGLYLDVANGATADCTNIQVCYGNNSKAQMFKLKETQMGIEIGSYGKSGLKYQGNVNGTELKYYRFGLGPNVFFATFAIHGWEDCFNYDGQELTKIANAFKDKLVSINDVKLANKWTIFIFPSLNPDGEYFGWTHNGPGRTTLYSDAPEHKGIDLNRTWSIDWVKYTTDRNYTGTEPFQAYESRCLRDFLLSHKSSTGQTVLVDLHGWLNETMGDDEIGGYYQSQLGMSKHISAYGRGYLINWARANLGSNGKTARSVLIELPEANSSQDVNNLELSDKYINATINMLRNI